MSTIRYISFCFRICMIMNMYEHLLNVRNIQIHLRFKYILYSHLSLIWFQKVYSVVRKFCTQMTKTYLMQSVCLQHHKPLLVKQNVLTVPEKPDFLRGVDDSGFPESIDPRNERRALFRTMVPNAC